MITSLKQNTVFLSMVAVVVVICFLGHTDISVDNLEKQFNRHLEMLLDQKFQQSQITLTLLEALLRDTQNQVKELQKEIQNINTAVRSSTTVCNCVYNNSDNPPSVEKQPQQLQEDEQPNTTPSHNFDLASVYIQDLTDPCVEVDVKPILNGSLPCTGKGAFIYLAPPKDQERYIKRIHLMSFSIQRIEIFYVRNLQLYKHEGGKIKYHYPMIIFHEDYGDPEMQYLRSQMIDPDYPIIFEKIDFNSSLFVPPCAGDSDFDDEPCNTSLGYQKMCRFWSGIMQNLPIMAEFDYYWRMDDDSSLLGPVSMDLFKRMEERNLSYMYELVVTETQGRSQHWLTKEYLESKGRSYPRLDWPAFALGPNQAVYNNLHISALKLWRSQMWRDYFYFMEEQQCGFFHQCWGDAVFHTNFMFVALTPSDTERVGGEVIPYSHNFHVGFGYTFFYEPAHVVWMRPLCKNVL